MGVQFDLMPPQSLCNGNFLWFKQFSDISCANCVAVQHRHQILRSQVRRKLVRSQIPLQLVVMLLQVVMLLLKTHLPQGQEMERLICRVSKQHCYPLSVIHAFECSLACIPILMLLRNVL